MSNFSDRLLRAAGAASVGEAAVEPAGTFFGAVAGDTVGFVGDFLEIRHEENPWLTQMDGVAESVGAFLISLLDELD